MGTRNRMLFFFFDDIGIAMAAQGVSWNADEYKSSSRGAQQARQIPGYESVLLSSIRRDDTPRHVRI